MNHGNSEEIDQRFNKNGGWSSFCRVNEILKHRLLKMSTVFFARINALLQLADIFACCFQQAHICTCNEHISMQMRVWQKKLRTVICWNALSRSPLGVPLVKGGQTGTTRFEFREKCFTFSTVPLERTLTTDREMKRRNRLERGWRHKWVVFLY